MEGIPPLRLFLSYLDKMLVIKLLALYELVNLGQ